MGGRKDVKTADACDYEKKNIILKEQFEIFRNVYLCSLVESEMKRSKPHVSII